MKPHLPCLISLLLSVTVAAAEQPAAEGAAPGLWTMDLEAARKVAAEKKLPILINFTGSDWCGWCKHMDQEVFSHDDWATYAKSNFLLVWIDFPTDKSLVPEKFVPRNKALSETYGIKGYPTYIVLDDDGQSVLGQLGADSEITPKKFIGSLNALLQNRATAVAELLKALPEKTVQAYHTALSKKAAASAALKQTKAELEKKSQQLEQEIAAQEMKIGEIRLEARLARLPKDKADVYRSKKAQCDKIKSELDAWIAAKPERTDANMKKFTDWRQELEALANELAALLDSP
ncbi:MAG TPA: thioredoxin family protein [Kiritimatiellia bacterium]|nr:thioredoxin family protein [Kiritimatiellia bacterium]HPS09220.1 thioredoxin family protein [Kiritimatiellia bacterium]